MVVNRMAERIHWTSKENGFWEDGTRDKYVIATKLALIHSEVTEALEELRNNEKVLDDSDKFMEELADIVIRTFDLSEAVKGEKGIGDHVMEKMEKNENRPYKHGKSF